jgi:hypothetical protein
VSGGGKTYGIEEKEYGGAGESRSVAVRTCRWGGAEVRVVLVGALGVNPSGMVAGVWRQALGGEGVARRGHMDLRVYIWRSCVAAEGVEGEGGVGVDKCWSWRCVGE